MKQAHLSRLWSIQGRRFARVLELERARPQDDDELERLERARARARRACRRVERVLAAVLARAG